MGFAYYNNAPIEPSKKYTYNALYRLLSGDGRELIGLAKASSGGYVADSVSASDTQAVHKYTQTFEYDELGNILKLEHKTSSGATYDWTRNYVYDTATNRLQKHDVLQTLDSYQYDAHGNMTQMPHLSSMSWTFRDELKEVSLNAGGDKAYYTYDSEGNRARKVVKKGTVREETYYLGDYEIYSKFVNEILEKSCTTVHVTDDKERIALIENESGQTVVRYQLNDHLGSSAIELDENANIISYEEYHPFGTTSYQKLNGNISQKRYKYVGKEKDNETGLYYYGARYYASWLCRFVSVDPLAIERQWLTPYNYVQNNPINRIDPTGALDEDPPTESKDSQNSEGKKSSDPNDLLRKFNEFFGFASPKDTTLLHQAINNTVEKLSSARDASSYYLNGALYSETGSEQQKVLFDLYDSSKADVKKYEDGLAILIRAAYKTHKYNKNIADYNDGFTLLLDSSAKILEYGTYGVTAIETMGALPGLIGGMRSLIKPITTTDGFLLGSIGFKSPVNLRVGLYASENTIKYGTFKWSTIAPRNLAKNQWFGRRMLQITPEFQPSLGQWSQQVIKKGEYIRVGLVGPQKGMGFGSWLQIYAPKGVKFIK